MADDELDSVPLVHCADELLWQTWPERMVVSASSLTPMVIADAARGRAAKAAMAAAEMIFLAKLFTEFIILPVF